MFSVFEPFSWFYLPLNWLIGLFLALAIPSQFWVSKNTLNWGTLYFLSIFQSNLKANVSKMFNPGGILVFISLLIYIVFSNLLGLLPYVFTQTSHLTITLALALPLWAGHYFYSWLKNTEHMLAHLVPSGTPALLMSFMVLIELISSMIRPITLSVRLAANMIAGHLLLTLISSSVKMSMILFIMLGVIALVILESAVAFIQAYVFSILSVLYVEEVSSYKMC